MGENAEFRKYLERLYPVMRSLTGEGVRATHRALAEIHPLETIEVPSGTKVFDWAVPPEWSVREAFLIGPDGRRILDVKDHPLYLLNYSQPFRGKIDRQTLEGHLFSDPDRPQTIPYITSYYAPRWGFCIPQARRVALPDGDYEVVIDTTLAPGSMTLSQAIIPGETKREVLISSYTCHPGLANDELAAPIAMAMLARRISQWPRRRLTYRFVFIPETIGSITFLSLHGEALKKNILAGFNVSNIGYPEPIRYKKSRLGNATADRVATHVLKAHGDQSEFLDFYPTGSDERQYCSPGFDLPVGAIRRAIGEFPSYHCSDDRPESISDEAVVQTLDVLEKICRTLDDNLRYRNLKPYGEPHLGRYGLYPTIGEVHEKEAQVEAVLWVLSYSDGNHDLLAIAERSGKPFELIAAAAQKCLAAGLLTPCGD